MLKLIYPHLFVEGRYVMDDCWTSAREREVAIPRDMEMKVDLI